MPHRDTNNECDRNETKRKKKKTENIEFVRAHVIVDQMGVCRKYFPTRPKLFGTIYVTFSTLLAIAVDSVA